MHADHDVVTQGQSKLLLCFKLYIHGTFNPCQILVESSRKQSVHCKTIVVSLMNSNNTHGYQTRVVSISFIYTHACNTHVTHTYTHKIMEHSEVNQMSSGTLCPILCTLPIPLHPSKKCQCYINYSLSCVYTICCTYNIICTHNE